jgi:hypothetical protein
MPRSYVPAGLAGLLVLAVSGVPACSNDCPNCPGSPAVVVVSPQTVSVLPGRTVRLAALVYDADTLHLLSGYTTAWSTSNPSIATIDDSGTVAGVTAGSVTITADAAGKSGTGTAQVVTSSTLSAQVTPILKTSCALAYCHRPEPSGGKHADGTPLPFFDTSPHIYEALVTGDTTQLIVPGDSTLGEMLKRLRVTDSTRMPPVGAGSPIGSYAAVARGNFDLITLWVQSGAPNN